MNGPYIVLWLEAPLQSWGIDSKFCRRDTQKFPTKSGILGLICCSLGASGEQREFLSQFSTLAQTVFSFVRAGCPKEPVLSDFQMVGSNYNSNDPWENLMIPKTKSGAKSVGGGVKLTYRNYLQDAVFAVLLEVPATLANDLENALINPAWDIFLGRKNCVPTDFIYRGTFYTQIEAEEHISQIAQKKSLNLEFRVLEGKHEGGEVLFVKDVPLQFGEAKQYIDRCITVLYEPTAN